MSLFISRFITLKSIRFDHIFKGLKQIVKIKNNSLLTMKYRWQVYILRCMHLFLSNWKKIVKKFMPSIILRLKCNENPQKYNFNFLLCKCEIHSILHCLYCYYTFNSLYSIYIISFRDCINTRICNSLFYQKLVVTN